MSFASGLWLAGWSPAGEILFSLKVVPWNCLSITRSRSSDSIFWSTAGLALSCEEAARRLGPRLRMEGAGGSVRRPPVCKGWFPHQQAVNPLMAPLVKHPLLISTSQSRTRGFQKSWLCSRVYWGTAAPGLAEPCSV